MEWKETERSIMTNVLEWMKNKKLTIIEATALHCAFKSNREQEFDLVSHQSTKLLAFVRPKSVRWMNRWVCVCVCDIINSERRANKPNNNWEWLNILANCDIEPTIASEIKKKLKIYTHHWLATSQNKLVVSSYLRRDRRELSKSACVFYETIHHHICFVFVVCVPFSLRSLILNIRHCVH